MGDKKPFWVSWWHTDVAFELHSPWYKTGQRDSDDAVSLCAAVMALDEEAARQTIVTAHDEPVSPEWRFVEEKPIGWSPFGDRFPRGDWMQWDD